jgi:cytochrome P450
MLMTVDHKLHASRRAILHTFFSKMSILGLESMIQSKVDKLARRIEIASQAGTVFNLDSAFAAIASDVIAEYSYGFCLNYLDQEDFGNEIRDSMLGILTLSHLMIFFPIPLSVAKIVPKKLLQRLSPAVSSILHVQGLCFEQAKVALKDSGKGRDTMFGALCDPSLPPAERTPARIRDEAFSMLNAGTETTAGVLRVIFFHLLHDKTKLLHLRNELEQFPSSSVTELEKLPYMVRFLYQIQRA